MGAHEMVDRIKAEAKEEGERILNEARANAQERLAEVQRELEAQRKQFVEAEERKGAKEKDRIVRAARQQARRLKWAAEEELINTAFDNALDRLKTVKRSGFEGKSYADILAGLIKESAVSIAGGGGAVGAGAAMEVLLSEEDAKANYVDQPRLAKVAKELSAEASVDGKLSLSDQRLKSAGGVLVRRTDGKIEVNNTFEQRMTRFSTSLREEIVKTLFAKNAS
jgi:vacuolar-type H+-ATPase subunit E/Vma4